MAAVISTRRLPWSAVTSKNFFDWWLDGLMLWLTPHTRQRLRPPARRTWIRSSGDEWAVWTPDGPDKTATFSSLIEDVLVRFPDRPRWLLLDHDMAVHATLQLPLAAIDRLKQAVRYDIDKQTPYLETDVAYDVRIVERDLLNKRIVAELLAMPKTDLAELVERCARDIGAAIGGVDVADNSGQPVGVNLLDNATSQPKRWRRINFFLLTIMLAALSLSAWLSVANLRSRADALRVQVNQQADLAREVSLQRHRLDNLVAGAGKAQAARSGRADIVSFANALAQRIPIGVHLDHLRLEGSRLQLTGQGTSAVNVVSYLAADSLWQVQSPTDSGVDQGNTQFDIILHLKAQGAR